MKLQYLQYFILQLIFCIKVRHLFDHDLFFFEVVIFFYVDKHEREKESVFVRLFVFLLFLFQQNTFQHFLSNNVRLDCLSFCTFYRCM